MHAFHKKFFLLFLTLVLLFLILESGFRFYSWVREKPRIVPPIEYDPRLGYRLSKNSSSIMTINPQGMPITVTTDAKGYRYVPGTGNDNKKIVCLGDSHMFGYHTQEVGTLPHFISEHLTNFEVTNAGVPGYTSWQIIQKLEYEIQDSRNEIFIVVMGNNDYGYACLGDWDPDVVPRRNILRFINIFRRSYFLSFLFNKAYISFGGLGREFIPNDPEKFISTVKQRPFLNWPNELLLSTIQKRIAHLDKLASQYNKIIIVLPIPNLLENGVSDCEEELLLPIMRIMPINYDQYQKDLIAINDVIENATQNSKNLKFININDVLRNDPNCIFFTDGEHLNSEGNKLAAEMITLELKKLIHNTDRVAQQVVIDD